MKKYLANNPNWLINEIKMNHPVNCYTIIVEGADDARFYNHIFDKEMSRIVPAHNKANVISAMKTVKNDNIPKTFGILDSDYDQLLNNVEDDINLYFTDGHDTEMMIVSTAAFDKFLTHRVYSRAFEKFLESKKQKDLRLILLNSLKPLGHLRVYNHLNPELRFFFRTLPFKLFFSPETLDIDVDAMIKTVRQYSQPNDVTDEEIKSNMNRTADEYSDLWHVVNGHDFVKLLSLGLVHIFGHNRFKQKHNPEELETILRSAFGKEHFLQTNLYQSISRNIENCNSVLLN